MTVSLPEAVLRLHPGRPLPTISGLRAQWVPRFTAGRVASQLPALLGSLFTLCASTHRLVARLAVAAARGEAAVAEPSDLRALQLSQAREQILRITLDWPRQLPGVPGAMVDAEPARRLRDCPLWRRDLDAESQLRAMPAWLEHEWLDLAPEAWLRGHRNDPREWAARWCAAGRGPVAALLRSQLLPMQALATPANALDLLRDPTATMPALAALMAGEPGFCSRPEWGGRVCDTGPWSRVNDPASRAADGAWPRLVSRVADALMLAGPTGDRWLAHGAMTLGTGEGVAWAEMARGLLVHRVRLAGQGDDARVAACQVLAPTEWNFHPGGLLAQALSGLRGAGAVDAARRLACTFDPCVALAVEDAPEEAAHA
ncbi:hydrogenase formation protein [Ideonella sp. A 288]|uniref:hydrogenase formation protein n=1 Tax=Ideonella sp. A 288 TaxID=1962181 RepID=UPI000B4B0D6A|nr:hydrogenase formation protein [Ideonella sp. A 288]